jgi:hypothetical protein
MKKIKPLIYIHFDIIKKVNENAFRLRFPPYMQISSIVNVEYMRLFEPSILDGEENHLILPNAEEFSPHALEELKEDKIMYERNG